jgi:signal transduction histidine kinase
MRSKSGDWKWILAHGKVFEHDEAGKPLRMAGTHKDISDRKQAEEALRQSEGRERKKAQELKLALNELKRTQAQLIQTEKMSSLGRMVAGIAHEINNPVSFIQCNLTPARGYFRDLLALIELYQQTYPHPTPEIQQFTEEIDLEFLVEDCQKLMHSMQVGAERIEEIVLSLKSFSRLDEAELKRVDIHEGIDTSLMILQHRLRAEGNRPEIKVIKHYSQLPLVSCYASQLNQVFMNLLDNAIDALENQASPRVITISTSILIKESPIPSSQFAVIRIADNGPGMSEQVRQQMFDPFFTTKPVGNGTGLGLAISHQIVVEKHLGQISCVSTPGQGTEVIVEIPVHLTRTLLS